MQAFQVAVSRMVHRALVWKVKISMDCQIWSYSARTFRSVQNVNTAHDSLYANLSNTVKRKANSPDLGSVFKAWCAPTPSVSRVLSALTLLSSRTVDSRKPLLLVLQQQETIMIPSHTDGSERRWGLRVLHATSYTSSRTSRCSHITNPTWF